MCQMLQIPTSSCVIFIVVTPAMLFGTSNYLMCHIFLILSYVYIFLSEPYLSIIPFSSCVSSITVSPAMSSTTSNTSSQTPSVNGRQPNNPTEQHLPWSGNVSTLLPPCCLPLPPLKACCLLIAAQRWCWPSQTMPSQSSSFDQWAANCPENYNKVSIICFNCLNTILATPRQQLSAPVTATVISNGDGNCDGQQ